MTAPPGNPAFFNEHGPMLSFVAARTDGVREMWAVISSKEHSPRHVITLQAGDVRQLETFCRDWRLAGLSQRELDRAADEMTAHADQLRVEADRRPR